MIEQIHRNELLCQLYSMRNSRSTTFYIFHIKLVESHVGYLWVSIDPVTGHIRIPG